MPARYLAAWIVDANFIAIMVLFILLQISLGNEYFEGRTLRRALAPGLERAALTGLVLCLPVWKSALGVSDVVLYATLYQARLLSCCMLTWGIAGYAVVFCGMLYQRHGL